MGKQKPTERHVQRRKAFAIIGSLPFTLSRINCPPKTTKNGTFRKRFSKWISLKLPALRFSVDEKYFENGTFSKPLPSMSG